MDQRDREEHRSPDQEPKLKSESTTTIKPGRTSDLSLQTRAEAVLQAEDMLSSLTSTLAINSRGNDVSGTKRDLRELERPPEIPEHERQRLVEMELYHKTVERKRSLVKFGEDHGVRYITYGGEHHLKEIMELITKDLSEPYSIYTYRYFIYQWPKLCHLAIDPGGKVVGAIVCKMENTKGSMGQNDNIRRGYIAMLAVDEAHRRKKTGTALVVSAVESLMNNACDEVVLETETTNQAALKLYENLGFARHKRLLKYYLNGVDAFRLKLWIKYPTVIRERGRAAVAETLDPNRCTS